MRQLTKHEKRWIVRALQLEREQPERLHESLARMLNECIGLSVDTTMKAFDVLNSQVSFRHNLEMRQVHRWTAAKLLQQLRVFIECGNLDDRQKICRFISTMCYSTFAEYPIRFIEAAANRQYEAAWRTLLDD